MLIDGLNAACGLLLDLSELLVVHVASAVAAAGHRWLSALPTRTQRGQSLKESQKTRMHCIAFLGLRRPWFRMGLSLSQEVPW